MSVKSIREVAVLFALTDSIYKSIYGCDVYDIERDALTYKDGMPIIAHPPCRAWGKLRHFAKHLPGERDLAIWAIDKVRKNGGVLELPEASKLWPEMNLPKPWQYDKFGGFTLGILQWWFGHKAEKRTKLYICGIKQKDIPRFSLKMGYPEFVVTTSKRKHSESLREISKKERKMTPPKLAYWLVELARRTKPLK